MKKYAIALLFFCTAAQAQSLLGLQYPFGMPDAAHTGAAAAMGGSGTAVAEEYFGMDLNPANIAIGKRSAFSSNVSFDFVSMSDNGKSSSVSAYTPKLLTLILPIGTAGNIGFTMQRRSDANLNYYTSNIDIRDSLKVTNTIELQNVGSLSAWQAGWGYRLKNGLAFGAAYERFYFNKSSDNIFKSSFEYNLWNDKNRFSSGAKEALEESFAADGIRFGIQVPVHEKVTAGVAAEYIFRSDNGEATREYTRPDQPASEAPEKSSGTFSVRMPPSMNIGVACTPDERWLIAADAHGTLWDRYWDSRGESDKLRPAYGFSAGARFTPAATKRLSAKYWEKILYSAGFKYGQLPFEESHEYALSLGTGLPIPGDGGVIDIVFELGRRSAHYKDYGENVVKFQLGINGGRDWFRTDAASRF